MPIFLVRHGKAGDRRKWDGPDDLRSLSKKGRAQAEGLAEMLGGHSIGRILSSPSVRCVQTVEPLAERLGLAVEEDEALAEGASGREVVALARSLVPAIAVLSTHGDVIPTLLETLAHKDGLELPEDYPCAKGSVWVLEATDDARFTKATYLPPPPDG